MATALEAGTKPPAAKHAETFERQLADARRAAATAIVRENRWRQVAEAFEQHGDELREQVEQSFEQLRAEYVARLDELIEAHRKVSGAFRMKAFCDDSANGTPRYRAGATYPAVDEIPVPPEKLRDNMRLALVDVFELQRDVGTPPRLPPGLNPDFLRRSRDDPLRKPGRTARIRLAPSRR